ncbi:DUF421 domain-containing protein [Bacillus kwashiorkori]|uniref:DUF421 domain-containing protein n=1 Tax=Bacillus kwashiorkori TaxID=1522318 RepID=UPI00078321D5|nr:DUF421 domain-containing protein [Bacillus kwashiorkori]
MPEWLQIVLRALLFIIFLFIITKLVGKKQIVQMTFFDYISGITIGSIAAELITGLERNIFHGLLGISVFGIVTMLADFAVLKSKKLRNFVDGRASIFIKNGKVLKIV